MSHNKDSPVLHIAFYPWFALGHLTSFLRVANKLAERGHRVSYFLPTKTQSKLAPHNHYPDHLTFIPIDVPPVNGLPPGAETTNDVPASAWPLIMTAMDMTRDTIEAHLIELKPNFVFYDFAHWIPQLVRKHGFKSVHYITAYIARYAYFAPYLKTGRHASVTELVAPPPGFPSSLIRMQAQEAEALMPMYKKQYGLGGLMLPDRVSISFRECDAIGVKTCKEMEGAYCEYVENILGKPVLLAGPMVPKPPSSELDEGFGGWLMGFGTASVLYCALGSECILEKNQFQELILGLELTGAFFYTPSIFICFTGLF